MRTVNSARPAGPLATAIGTWFGCGLSPFAPGTAGSLGALLPAIGVSTVIATAATFVELFTPLGIDNLTVPLAVAALYAGVFV